MLLAHDVGTTGDKASLHHEDGRLVAAVTATYPTHYGHGGVAEQEPAGWWRAVCSATHQLLERAGIGPEDVSAVAISGQMMGATLLDRGGEPVRPTLIWADHRSTAECRAVIEQVGMDVAYRIIGHRLDPTYTLTKLMWVRDHEPENWRRVATVCQAKDYVNFRLTGVLATDPSDASSMNAYDQGTGAWSATLLEAAGIEERVFPELCASATVIGEVGAAVAGEVGLRAGTPVVMGGGDGPMAAAGVGAVAPGAQPYAYLGSSSWVSFASDKPLHDPSMRTVTFNHVVPGCYVPTATMQAGGGALQWAVELLSDAGGPADYGALTTAAADVQAAAEGLYFLPHLLGERSPYWNPSARGAFVGLMRHHGPAHLVRAVLEGVAFNLFTCIQAFQEAGADFSIIDVVGGGAASDVWLQILADVWNARVRRRSIVEEANSLGTAVTAGVGIGSLADFGVADQLSTITAEFAPDPGRHVAYREAHAAFLDAYGHLEPWFAR